MKPKAHSQHSPIPLPLQANTLHPLPASRDRPRQAPSERYTAYINGGVVGGFRARRARRSFRVVLAMQKSSHGHLMAVSTKLASSLTVMRSALMLAAARVFQTAAKDTTTTRVL